MIALFRNRRSIRKYKPIRLDQQIIDSFKEALLRSPSSRGINPWEFIFITRPEQLTVLSKAKMHGSSFLCGAPLAIVICGDEKKSDVWIEDCSIASIFVQLTAHALGLGSCWIQIRNRKHTETVSSEEFVQSQLCIPQHIRVESIISIGIPDEVLESHSENTLEFGKIHCDKF
jgi:nitroreductase